MPDQKIDDAVAEPAHFFFRKFEGCRIRVLDHVGIVGSFYETPINVGGAFAPRQSRRKGRSHIGYGPRSMVSPVLSIFTCSFE